MAVIGRVGIIYQFHRINNQCLLVLRMHQILQTLFVQTDLVILAVGVCGVASIC